MLNKKKYLAIIPARGGSKRLPRKNILDLAGKPLIVWTIEAALQSQYIDTVLVTSDDDEILAIADQSGARIIKRPSYLASDTATSFDAIKHAIENTKWHDCVILLQPTSPLRTSQHIDEAIQLLESKSANAIISVTEMEHSPDWANTLPEDGSMIGFLKEETLNKRSQDLEKQYRLNGAIYICQTSELLREKSFFIKDKIFAYKMDSRSSVDVDTAGDFNWAIFLINSLLS